jgi:hypothetical protein
MSVIKGCIVAAVALVAGAIVESARADEAYVCDAGRIAYVRPGELEMKKLQDPCIAKYFENTQSVKPAAAKSAAASPTTTSAPQPAAATPVAPNVPMHKTSVQTSAAPPHADVPASDYRNVRIINAAPGADAWFHHRY